MTRRKVFIAFAAAVMILVLTAALFVACDQTKTYTVTFKDGETVVKTVSVKDGATIADADLPADPTKDGAVFEGWFDGDKAFDKTAAITGDVTYTAKWTSLFTVTFKDGDTVIATATVKDGEKIAASDIPANLADTQDAAFEGWFNGDSAFDKDAAITASVTYNAKWTGLFSVTFMNGDTQVKSVKVKDGEKIADADIPSDPAFATPEYAFGGWFNGEVEFDEDATVESNVVYTAKWNKVAYVVTFKNGDEVVKTSYIEIAEGAKLTAEDLADAVTFDDGRYFLGWYDGEVKAVADMAINADVTFTAFVVDENSYAGAYTNADKTAFLTIADQSASIGAIQTRAYTFDETTNGSIVVHGDGAETYTITLQKNGSVYIDHYYDEYGDGYIQDYTHEYFTYTRIAATGFAGTYRADNNEYFEMTDSGIIKKYKGSSVLYGILYESDAEGVYVLKYKTSKYSAEVKINVTIDSNGNICADNIVYVKGTKTLAWAEGKYQDAWQSLYIHTLEDGSKVYVFKDTDKTVKIASLTGTVADGEMVTVTVGEKSYTFKLSQGSSSTRFSFAYPAAEVGTYTGANGEIVLDGYGTATIGGVKKSYVVSGDLVWITGSTTIKVDTEAKTYAAADSIGMAGSYVYFMNYNYSAKYTLKLDGYGIAVCVSNGTTYVGSYTVADGKVVIKNAGTANNTYTIFDTDKGLQYKGYSGTTVWYNADNTVERADVDYSKFIGYFANGDKAIEISKLGSYYFLDGFASTSQRINTSDEWGFNWDGTVLVYNYDDPCSYYKKQKADYYFSINEDGNLVVRHLCKEDDGDGGYNLVERTVVYTKTTKPVTFADSFVGTWYTNTDTVEITKTTITVNGVLATDLAYDDASYTYTFKVNGVAYKAVDNVNTMSFGKADGTLETLLATKPVAATIEDFVGTYNGDYSGTVVAITIDSIDKATLSINGESIEITKIELGFDYIAFTTASETYKIKREADGASFNYYFNDSAESLGYYGMGIQLTKEAKAAEIAIPEDFQGTWKYVDKDTNTNITWIIDGSSVSIDASGDGNYQTAKLVSLVDGVLTYDLNGATETLTLNADKSLQYDNGYPGSWNINAKLTKEAEETTNAFVGTWSGKIGVASWTIVINSDGTFTANGTTYHYTIDSETKASSVEADGSDKLFTFELKGDKLRVDRYDSDMCETFTGDLTKQA